MTARLRVDLFQARESLFRDGDGFARAEAFMAGIGSPQERVPVVHVAGTAGKGSTAYAIAAGLRTLGLRTGLHVSPDVYDLRERWQVDGDLGSEEEAVELFNAVTPMISTLAASVHGPPTFFEVTVGMSFLRFARADCDIAVVETGLGGLYDATNTISRVDKIAVLTRIGFDHEAVLGNDLYSIALQKAGIFPVGGTAFAAATADSEVSRAFDETARIRGCQLHYCRPVDGDRRPVAQRENTAVALATVGEVARRWGIIVDITSANYAVVGATAPGRFELLEGPARRIAVLDGAHNPLKLGALIERIDQELDAPTVFWIFGCRRDKKANAMVTQLLARGGPVRFVQFQVSAGDVPADVSAAPAELEALAREINPAADAKTSVTLGAAVDEALHAGLTIVITGSFHLLALVKPLLNAAGWRPAG